MTTKWDVRFESGLIPGKDADSAVVFRDGVTVAVIVPVEKYRAQFPEVVFAIRRALAKAAADPHLFDYGNEEANDAR